MARIRSIHPGIWTDVQFVSLQPLARLMLIGIWNECDDQGIFQWSPLMLKMRLLPADHADADALLGELMAHNFLMKYDALGKSFGAVRNFTKYQRPKAPNSTYPISPEARAYVAGITPTMGNLWGNPESDGGDKMEDGGEEGGGMRKRATKTACPADFVPTPTAATKTAERMAKWTPDFLAEQIEKFIAHHTAKETLSKSWQQSWTTWVLNDFDGKGNAGGRSGKPSGWLA